jgi:raffinose/stachyose/melibiose transport system permease protein
LKAAAGGRSAIVTGRLQGIGNGFLLIGLVVITVLMFSPLIWLFYSSFKTNQEIFSNAWSLPSRISFQGFVSGWRDAAMGRTLLNSLLVVGVSIVGIMALALPASFAFARIRFRGSNLLFLILLSGLMIPVQATIVPLYAMFHSWRWLDRYQSVIMPYIALGLPFSVFLLRSYFLTLPRELEDAALIDGYSRFGVFLRIFLPLVTPGIATAVIFVSVVLFNELLLGMLFLTSDEHKTLPVMLYAFFGKHFGNYQMMFCTLTMIVFPLIVVFFVFQKQFVQGLTAGALKE